MWLAYCFDFELVWGPEKPSIPPPRTSWTPTPIGTYLKISVRYKMLFYQKIKKGLKIFLLADRSWFQWFYIIFGSHSFDNPLQCKHNRCTFEYLSGANLCGRSLDCTITLHLLKRRTWCSWNGFFYKEFYPDLLANLNLQVLTSLWL